MHVHDKASPYSRQGSQLCHKTMNVASDTRRGSVFGTTSSAVMSYRSFNLDGNLDGGAWKAPAYRLPGCTGDIDICYKCTTTCSDHPSRCN